MTRPPIAAKTGTQPVFCRLRAGLEMRECYAYQGSVSVRPSSCVFRQRVVRLMPSIWAAVDHAKKGLVSVDTALLEPGTEKRAEGVWRMYGAFCYGV